GLEHPSDVAFGPDGAMYVTDWGVANITVDGLKLEPNTGVVWRITPGQDGAGIPGGISLLYTIIGTLALGIVTFTLIRGARDRVPLVRGLLAGLGAGLVMGGVAILVSHFVLNLPWYAPPRVFATMVMGRAAVANILEFVWLPFIVGLAVVLILTGLLGLLFGSLVGSRDSWRVILGGLLYGLTVFGLLQYALLPPLFPLVAEKGFPPLWYAAVFAVFGLTLGILIAVVRDSEAASAR
ncbi:MAG TPA: hypothetical protein VJ820_20100, partial [Propionibacteriaceae bacterium]|nr:hypothetical protein [Propionibacteriaceae bacterium]